MKYDVMFSCGHEETMETKMITEIDESKEGHRLFRGANGKYYIIETWPGYDDPKSPHWDECNIVPRPRHHLAEMSKRDDGFYYASMGENFWTYTDALKHLESIVAADIN